MDRPQEVVEHKGGEKKNDALGRTLGFGKRNRVSRVEQHVAGYESDDEAIPNWRRFLVLAIPLDFGAGNLAFGHCLLGCSCSLDVEEGREVNKE